MKAKKLTKKEITTLTEIKTKNEAVVKEFGLIKIAEIALDERQERAEAFLNQLRASEVEVAKTLEKKYGKGTVNLETGEFNAIS